MSNPAIAHPNHFKRCMSIRYPNLGHNTMTGSQLIHGVSGMHYIAATILVPLGGPYFFYSENISGTEDVVDEVEHNKHEMSNPAIAHPNHFKRCMSIR
jgi:hypothetical protein